MTAVQPAVPPKSAVVDASIQTADGRVRTYHLYVPSGVQSGAITATLPLLVALHGGLGNGKQFERTSGFDGIAEANNFLVVYPDGVGTGWACHLGGVGVSVPGWRGMSIAHRFITSSRTAVRHPVSRQSAARLYRYPARRALARGENPAR